MIAGAIGFDSEHHPSRLVRMRTGEVYAIAGNAVLGCNRDTTAIQSLLDGKIKWVEEHLQYVRTQFSPPEAAYSLSEQVDTLRGMSGSGPCRDG